MSYGIVTKLNKKSKAMQVIGEEAWEVFSTFGDWASEGDKVKIGSVLAKFESLGHLRNTVLFVTPRNRVKRTTSTIQH